MVGPPDTLPELRGGGEDMNMNKNLAQGPTGKDGTKAEFANNSNPRNGSVESRKRCGSNWPRTETARWEEQSRLPGPGSTELSPVGWVGPKLEGIQVQSCMSPPSRRAEAGINYRCVFETIRCQKSGEATSKNSITCLPL